MTDTDPRLVLEDATFDEIQDLAVPAVARTQRGPGPAFAGAVLTVAAVSLFFLLSARRAEVATLSLVTPAPGAAPSAPEPELRLPHPQVQPAMIAAHAPAPRPVPMAPAPMTLNLPARPAVDPLGRRRAPAVVVSLQAAGPAAPAQLTQLPSAAAEPLRAPAGEDAEEPQSQAEPAAPAAATALPPSAATPEGFAARLSVGANETAVASPMRNPGLVVPQGAIVPAVLETAINSNLPGYARAVVSRDVRSFDGRTVLIPRGSRLVGQYRSALSLGESRAFVVWTRVTRPDGVSVDIASPAADALGRGGLEGEVDRHFFRRFAGSILLSVLNAGVASVGSTPTTQIAIGSPGAAANAAASAQQGDALAPTVKVAQGEAIRVFVSRDLDFSNVGPMR